MLANLVLFDVVVVFLAPVSPELVVMYNFFLPGIILVFVYSGYLVERTSRESFASSAQLRSSLNEVKRLSGMIPICASCKKIRDDEGYWKQVEQYIREPSDAEFTHGLCPDCVESLYPSDDDLTPA